MEAAHVLPLPQMLVGRWSQGAAPGGGSGHPTPCVVGATATLRSAGTDTTRRGLGGGSCRQDWYRAETVWGPARSLRGCPSVGPRRSLECSWETADPRNFLFQVSGPGLRPVGQIPEPSGKVRLFLLRV